MSHYAMQDVAARIAETEGSLISGACDMLAGPVSALPWPFNMAAHPLQASARMADLLTRRHGDPGFNIESVRIDGRDVAVKQDIAMSKPFCDLLHFRRDTDRKDPPVLLVAPMSGHYASLLRDTARTLLPASDLYVTEWKDARQIPASAGDYSLSDNVAYIRDFIRHIGGRCHVVAVCQPTVATLSAAALMAQDNDPARPLSLTVMGGPLDVRKAPTDVTRFADGHTLKWFESHIVDTVPVGWPGAGRGVYPGYKQLSSFMGMNPGRHYGKLMAAYNDLVHGKTAAAAPALEFYEDYLAVMDLPGSFYLDTIRHVFKDPALPQGKLYVHGRRVDPGAIRDIAVLTVEGGRDDISAPGQTVAAHDMLGNLPDRLKFNRLQEGAGHYGIFSGRAWREDIAPRVSGLMRHAARLQGLSYAPPPAELPSVTPSSWSGALPAAPRSKAHLLLETPNMVA